MRMVDSRPSLIAHTRKGIREWRSRALGERPMCRSALISGRKSLTFGVGVLSDTFGVGPPLRSARAWARDPSIWRAGGRRDLSLRCEQIS